MKKSVKDVMVQFHQGGVGSDLRPDSLKEKRKTCIKRLYYEWYS